MDSQTAFTMMTLGPKERVKFFLSLSGGPYDKEALDQMMEIFRAWVVDLDGPELMEIYDQLYRPILAELIKNGEISLKEAGDGVA